MSLRHRFEQGSRRVAVLGVVIASLAASDVASAAPCSGFTDVEDTSEFCPNVDWLKNRGITLGCTSSAMYCPNDPVSRLAMAAFMNRLGVALTPVRISSTGTTGAQDVDAAPVVCQTADYAVTGFPRTAYADLALSVSGDGPGGVAARVVVSSDAGLSWNALSPEPHRGAVGNATWSNFADLGSINVDVGQSVRFGVQLSRAGLAGPGDVTDGRCQLRVAIYSRDGAAAPF